MRPMPQLKVTEIPTDELVEYENNAKLHPHEQIDQIASSIQEFGFNSPILAWHNDEGEPEIVAGHGRLMAARKLGIEKMPVVFLDHMSEEQRRAYILVDNKLTMNSDFDFEILADELAALDSFDTAEFGFAESVDEAFAEDEIEQQLAVPEKGELPFTEFVDESSNYVVLKFRTEQDWLRAQSVLQLEQVKGFSTKRGGGGKSSFTGIGRVVDGNKAFELIAKAEGELAR